MRSYPSRRHSGLSPIVAATDTIPDRGPAAADAERAALELTEQGTRIADAAGGVTDEAWANAAKHYDTDQLAALVCLIARQRHIGDGRRIRPAAAGVSYRCIAHGH